MVSDEVMPLVERLLGCLCTQLAGTLAGEACVCCPYPGAVAPMDFCCQCEVDGRTAEGQAWVTVARIYPTTGSFPTQQRGPVTACSMQMWAADLTMGVYRCAAGPDARGNPPGCNQVSGDLAKVLSDAAAMRSAALCCFASDEVSDVAVGEWMPVGPTGGCVGGQMTVTVGFVECCPPATPDARSQCL